jgi:hypothetical protein
MKNSKSKWYKDKPETKQNYDKTRITVVCSDGETRRVSPTHPDYPGERVIKPVKVIDPMVAKLRQEDQALYAVSDNKQSLLKHGFVYVISNPAWSSWVKVGHSRDPERRLSSYNTGCPERDYTLDGYIYFEKRLDAEQKIHQALKEDGFLNKGEWFKCSPSYALIKLGELDEAINTGYRNHRFSSYKDLDDRNEGSTEWEQGELPFAPI